jgi:phosphocarrier protein HPr
MSPGDTPGGPLVRDLTIVNKRGLHARASARFVQLAESFDATITVSKDQTVVAGTSIMDLMMLAAGPGSVIRVTAEGKDAAAALAALEALLAERFGEDE